MMRSSGAVWRRTTGARSSIPAMGSWRFLTTSPSAVRAAADIQWHFWLYNLNVSESLSVRIGIHAGEPLADHNDLFGATVHLASRLCAEAEVDGIVVSGLVRELCEVDKASFVGLGERRLKGFAEQVPVFRLKWRGLKPPCNSTRNAS